jgi:transposase
MNGLGRQREARRCALLCYLPQYSPDLNSIEMPFSKLKASLRKAAELNREVPVHPNRPRSAQLFQHAGYE